MKRWALRWTLVVCLVGLASLSVGCRDGEPAHEEPLDVPEGDTGRDADDRLDLPPELDAVDGETDDAETDDAEMDDGGTAPLCEGLDELEPTEGFEFVRWFYPELQERAFYLLRWPRLDVGCVSYVPELEVLASPSPSDPSLWDDAAMRYRVHMCHTCDEDMVLHWWSIVDDEDSEREPLVNVNDLNIGVQLTDASSTALPWFCPGPRFVLCPDAWPEAAVLRAHRVVAPGELFVQPDHSDQLRPLYLFNDQLHAGGGGQEPLPDEPAYPYWDDPLDYTSALAIEAMLPRLWPASTPDDEVRPDMSVDIACRLAGIPNEGAACVDRTAQVPWSPDDLLLYRYEDVHLDENFLDWVEQSWPP